MTWKLIEPLVDALRTYLIANSAAKATAINAELGGTVAIAGFTEVHKGEHALERIQTWPAGYVLPDRGRLRLYNLSGAGGGNLDGGYRLRIGVMDKDQDPDVLRTRLMRYGRAIVEMLAEASASGALGAVVLSAEADLVVQYGGNAVPTTFLVADVCVEASFVIPGEVK